MALQKQGNSNQPFWKVLLYKIIDVKYIHWLYHKNKDGFIWILNIISFLSKRLRLKKLLERFETGTRGRGRGLITKIMSWSISKFMCNLPFTNNDLCIMASFSFYFRFEFFGLIFVLNSNMTEIHPTPKRFVEVT